MEYVSQNNWNRIVILSLSMALSQVLSGQVGISDAAITEDGILHLDNGAASTNFYIEKDGGTNADIIFHNAGVAEAHIAFDSNEDIVIENDKEDKDIIFKVDDGGVDTEIMRIDGDVSRVGIGIATPASLLHVAGAVRIGESTTTTGILTFNNSTNAFATGLSCAALTASYTMTLPVTQGGAYTYMENDGSGNLSWTSFTELMTALADPGDASWDDSDLTATGITDGDWVQILIENTNTDNEYEVGVRTNGSAVVRKFDLIEAEAGGVTPITMLVKSDSDGIIELYSEDASETNFYIIGYW